MAREVFCRFSPSVTRRNLSFWIGLEAQRKSERGVDQRFLQSMSFAVGRNVAARANWARAVDGAPVWGTSLKHSPRSRLPTLSGSNRYSRSAELPPQGPIVHAERAGHYCERGAVSVQVHQLLVVGSGQPALHRV